MRNTYIRPDADVILFTPNKAIAVQTPDWGWEEDVFGESGGEPQGYRDDEDAERRGGYEG